MLIRITDTHMKLHSSPQFGEAAPLTTRAAIVYAIQTFGLDPSCFQDVCGVIDMLIIIANDKMCKMVPPFLMT